MSELNRRLERLHRKHYNWLYAVAFKVSKSKEVSEDLIQELYLYLTERNDERLYFDDSFNLQYCRSFILSRFYNLCKFEDRFTQFPEQWDEEHVDYDVESDKRLHDSYDQVKRELDKLKKSPKWSSAFIFEMYWFDDKTYDEVSRDINISKSTSFLNVKKVREHLKNVVENPFTSSKN